MDKTLVQNITKNSEKCLTHEEKEKLNEQNERLVSEFQAYQLEKQAQKYWDLFYKRNETRFFKNRRWSTREFEELLHKSEKDHVPLGKGRCLLEVGCGVGNFIYPLIEELNAIGQNEYYFYACDFSPRAIKLVQDHPLYDKAHINAFQCDITTDNIHHHIPAESVDIISMIFVLSTITPVKFHVVIKNLSKLLKPGGVLLFRDYGRYDMSQLRFKRGNKISENFYMRQDGTRSYYFSESELSKLFLDANFDTIACSYVHRRTLNIKDGINVPRIFVQGKFKRLP